MAFLFKVKKKSSYDKGVIVSGKVLSGIFFCGDDVIVAVGKNEYKSKIDSIIDKPDGGFVKSCNIGNNVSLYLVGIDEQIIKPRITVVRNVESRNSFIGKDSQEPEVKKSSEREEKKKKVKAETVIHKKKSISQSIKNEYSSVEKCFIQDISVCLKNKGGIAPTELFVLDKLRTVYNISEERGRQLIVATVKKIDLEKNEMIYRDAVSACLLDCGYLTATERYLLEKLRVALNIPEYKAYSIEKESDWKV